MRPCNWKVIGQLAPLALLPLTGCFAPSHHGPPPAADKSASAIAADKDKVDLLFVIDNSPSMAPKQKELRDRIPRLMTAMQEFAQKGRPADYHIGVVTSDLGAGAGVGGCRAFPGDGAVLQTAPAAGCVDDLACKRLIPAGCDKFALTGATADGGNYLDLNQLDNTNNIEGGLDGPTAFTCMAMTGQRGCGFESQLEASYRALHDPPPANGGFLRPDALLVVVFVTDEDDCSAPADTDLFSGSEEFYGPLNSFRCTRFGIQCDGKPLPKMSTTMPLTNCTAMPNPGGQGPGKLIDLQKYVDFFGKPQSEGGIKADPNDVILVSVAGPASPVGVTATAPGSSGECNAVNHGDCVLLNHSCAAGESFFGDPAVRISQVVQAVADHSESSICSDNYGGAMDQLASLIGPHLKSR